MKYYLAKLLLVVLCSVAASAQSVKQNDFADLFMLKQSPELDSSINVDRLSSVERNLLIEKMYAVDQQYRDSLNRYWPDESMYKHFRRLVFVNDIANRTILLKILRKYGWPCDNDSTKLSTKAWHIAWHTRSNFELLSEFYSYMIATDQASCIDSTQLKAVEDQILLVKRSRGK